MSSTALKINIGGGFSGTLEYSPEDNIMSVNADGDDYELFGVYDLVVDRPYTNSLWEWDGDYPSVGDGGRRVLRVLAGRRHGGK